MSFLRQSQTLTLHKWPPICRVSLPDSRDLEVQGPLMRDFPRLASLANLRKNWEGRRKPVYLTTGLSNPGEQKARLQSWIQGSILGHLRALMPFPQLDISLLPLLGLDFLPCPWIHRVWSSSIKWQPCPLSSYGPTSFFALSSLYSFDAQKLQRPVLSSSESKTPT